MLQVNTTTATFKDNKMHHYEGGWPKDINMKDLEQTVRYRRKIEKDELYIHTMLQLIPVNHLFLCDHVKPTKLISYIFTQGIVFSSQWSTAYCRTMLVIFTSNILPMWK